MIINKKKVTGEAKCYLEIFSYQFALYEYHFKHLYKKKKDSMKYKYIRSLQAATIPLNIIKPFLSYFTFIYTSPGS